MGQGELEEVAQAAQRSLDRSEPAVPVRRPDHHRGLFRRRPGDARRDHPLRLLPVPQYRALARQHEEAAQLVERERALLRVRRGGQGAAVRGGLTSTRKAGKAAPRSRSDANHARQCPGINPRPFRSPSRHPVTGYRPMGDRHMSEHDNHAGGINRRKVLECMTWAGTGVLWTIAGGVPRSLGIVGEAAAAEPAGLTFLQISDSHIGFDKPANPNAIGTLEEAIGKIKTLPIQPAFVIHTGDITHLSKEKEFDDAQRIISQAGLDVHYVPGEHDIIDDEAKLYRERYGKNAKGAGWYSFDADGVHFIGLVNVVNLKAGGQGSLGEEQLKWLADDVKGKSAETPIVVFAHIPLWTVSEQWGWGTDDGARAIELLKRFGSVTVLNGHIHRVMQKVEGNVAFHTAMSTAFPQPAPGTAAAPGPMKAPAEKLRQVLGIREVNFVAGSNHLAVVDSPLGA